MGKFLFGLILGLIIGVVAMAYNPNLPQEVRTGLEELTAAVMRGTERAAEAVGGAADEAAEQAGDAAREVERETTREPDAPVEESAPANPPPAPQ
jgi:gas vesicle protein